MSSPGARHPCPETHHALFEAEEARNSKTASGSSRARGLVDLLDCQRQSQTQGNLPIELLSDKGFLISTGAIQGSVPVTAEQVMQPKYRPLVYFPVARPQRLVDPYLRRNTHRLRRPSFEPLRMSFIVGAGPHGVPQSLPLLTAPLAREASAHNRYRCGHPGNVSSGGTGYPRGVMLFC